MGNYSVTGIDIDEGRRSFLEKFGAIASDFRSDVYDRSEEVDPRNQRDWFSLQVGFGLARGLCAKDAHEFANGMRYTFCDGANVPLIEVK